MLSVTDVPAGQAPAFLKLSFQTAIPVASGVVNVWPSARSFRRYRLASVSSFWEIHSDWYQRMPVSVTKIFKSLFWAIFSAQSVVAGVVIRLVDTMKLAFIARIS